MKSFLTMFLILTLLAATTSFAEQIVVDFDDLEGGYTPIPAGYGGIADWAGWTTFDTPDENYPPHSGLVRCLAFSNDEIITFGQEYVFDGVWISGSYNPTWVVWFELYLGGVLVHTSEGLPPSSDPTWLPSGYDLAVDQVKIIHTFSNFFCFDDFTYTTTEVPVEGKTLSSVKNLYR